MEYIGKYKIQKELGAGGFGAVYLAEDPKLHELVAIKVFQIKDDNLARLATSATSDASDVLNQRFLNEARILRQLGKNPHIINVFDFDELEDGRPYYVMPYLPQSLKDELGSDATDISVISELPADEKPKRLPVTQALTYLTQLLKALRDVHKAGLVHRDIKPANLLINEDDEVQLCDFGIAKLPDVQHSQSGIGMGSRNYMAPEQRQSAKHVDARSDIYSVGVLAYRMITGTLPEGRFGEPNTFQPNLSDALNDLILKALEQQKESRFQDAGEMLKALKQAEQSQSQTDNDETGTWVGGESTQIKSELKPLETKIIELLQTQGEVRDNDKVYLQALADIADVDEEGLNQLIIQVTEQQQNSSAEQKALIQWTSGINKRLNTSQGQLDDTYIGSAVIAGATTTGKSEAQLQQLLSEKVAQHAATQAPTLETDLSFTSPQRAVYANQQATQTIQETNQNTNTNTNSSLGKVAFTVTILLFVLGGGYAGFTYYQTEQVKQQQTAIAKKNEQSAWSQAQKLNSIEGYQLYLKNWPQGQYAAQSKTDHAQLTEQARIAKLSQQEKRTEQINQAQQLLIQLNYQISITGKLDTRTIKAIEQFERSRKLIVTGEVDEVVLSNLTKAYDKKDSTAWTKAKKLNTSKSYQQYIDDFPYALKLTQAKKLIKDIEQQTRIAAAKAQEKVDKQKREEAIKQEQQRKENEKKELIAEQKKQEKIDRKTEITSFLNSHKNIIDKFNENLSSIKMFKNTKSLVWGHPEYQYFTEDITRLIRINRDGTEQLRTNDFEYSNQKTYKSFTNYGYCMSDLSIRSHIINQNKPRTSGGSPHYEPYLFDYTRKGGSVEHIVKSNGDSKIIVTDNVPLSIYDKVRSAKDNSGYDPNNRTVVITFNYDNDELEIAKNIYRKLKEIHSICQSNNQLALKIRDYQQEGEELSNLLSE